jgi:hypothetical protein
VALEAAEELVMGEALERSRGRYNPSECKEHGRTRTGPLGREVRFMGFLLS